jgi:hypothetical protein
MPTVQLLHSQGVQITNEDVEKVTETYVVLKTNN